MKRKSQARNSGAEHADRPTPLAHRVRARGGEHGRGAERPAPTSRAAPPETLRSGCRTSARGRCCTSKETHVPTPRFPVIDVHTHFTFTASETKGVPTGEKMSFNTTAQAAVAVMDRKGVKAVVNLTGGSGKGLEATLDGLDRAQPGRFWSCTEPSYGAWLDPRYPQIQADAIEKAARAGARGLKILKTLGLGLRERLTEGPLVKVDDARLDPMWEACAAHRLPVYMHVSDPEAFFLPIDCTNERWDELGHHPEWSFHGTDFPSHRELMAARDRVLGAPPEDALRRPARRPQRREPRLRLGVARPLPEPQRRDRCPDRRAGAAAASVADASSRRHQDRIFFGTDAVPPPAGRGDAAASLQGRALRDLLPLPGDGRRVLRLRAGAGAAAGPLADLRHRAARRHPAQGLPRERRAAAGVVMTPRASRALAASSLSLSLASVSVVRLLSVQSVLAVLLIPSVPAASPAAAPHPMRSHARRLPRKPSSPRTTRRGPLARRSSGDPPPTRRASARSGATTASICATTSTTPRRGTR